MLIQLEDDKTTLDLSQLTEVLYSVVYHSKGKRVCPSSNVIYFATL
jgi:hypothetical protein